MTSGEGSGYLAPEDRFLNLPPFQKAVCFASICKCLSNNLSHKWFPVHPETTLWVAQLAEGLRGRRIGRRSLGGVPCVPQPDTEPRREYGESFSHNTGK